MKKLILIVFLLSFNAQGKCVRGGGVFSGGGEFCFEPLPNDYATWEEIKIGEEGPIVPGWEKGLIAQMDEVAEVISSDVQFAKELCIDIYKQLDLINEIKSGGSLSSTFKYLKKAVLAFPKKNLVKKNLKKAAKSLKRFRRSN